MELSEQNFSIDHCEEKFVTYSPILERADQEDVDSSETVRNEGAEGATQKAAVEMESDVDKTDEVLPQNKSEANILANELVDSEAVVMGSDVDKIDEVLPQDKSEANILVNESVDSKAVVMESNVNKTDEVLPQDESEANILANELDDFEIVEMESDVDKTDEVLPQDKSEGNILVNELVDSEAVAQEKVEILKGVEQTIEVELVAKEAVQENNAQDMKPVSPQKSELNLFIGTQETDLDQISDVDIEVENATSRVEVGRPADKEQTLKVSVGIKQVEEDMAYPSPVFKSEVESPCIPIDIEAQQATELDSKFQASTTMFVKTPDVAEPIEKEQVAVSGSAVLQAHPIEVERKFQVTNFDENKLFQANGKLISEESFEDVYFDNNSYDLILSDCWLRKRNQRWEFKIPVNKNPSLLYMSTQFHELEDEKDIREALIEIIKPEGDFSENHEIIEEFKLKPFATFTTTRKSYKLPSACTVVIDFTSFGYSVGEIEMMVKDNSEIGEAIERIDAIAGQLGFQMLSIMELAKC